MDEPPVDFLSQRAAATPTRTALVETSNETIAGGNASNEDTVTFEVLDSLVDALAVRLREVVDSGDGQPGDSEPPRIGTLLSPRLEFVALFYATMRLGWTTVSLHSNFARSELQDALDRSSPDLLICERRSESLAKSSASCPIRSVETSDTIPSLWSGTETERHSIQPLSSGSDAVGWDSIGSDSIDSTSLEPASIEPTHTALILFTSGTTGTPKGVRLTVRNLEASAIRATIRLGTNPADRWLCCLPISHMGGVAPVVRTVISGTALVLQSSFDAAETAAIVDEHAVTGVSLVPTQLKRLLEQNAHWSGETVLLGGAPASNSLLERALDAGLAVYPTYGLTETTSQVATALPEEARDHPGTVGNPLLGTTVAIVDDDAEVEPGEHGEIVVAGPTVTPGYLDSELTAEAFSERGFHTGDSGYVDESGRLWVVGRRDELIQTGGELVSPTEVAETISSHAGVRDVAVVGLADEEWGQRVSALIVGDSNLETGDIREFCRRDLAGFKVPKTVGFAGEIPRTGSGTVDRDRVRALLNDA